MAITPEKAEHSRKLKEKHDLDFPLLTDEGLEVADRYGLRHEVGDDLREVYGQFDIDVGASNADGTWRLPLPARYVIAEDGKVVDAEVNADYTQRPDPDKTLEALKAHAD